MRDLGAHALDQLFGFQLLRYFGQLSGLLRDHREDACGERAFQHGLARDFDVILGFTLLDGDGVVGDLHDVALGLERLHKCVARCLEALVCCLELFEALLLIGHRTVSFVQIAGWSGPLVAPHTRNMIVSIRRRRLLGDQFFGVLAGCGALEHNDARCGVGGLVDER